MVFIRTNYDPSLDVIHGLISTGECEALVRLTESMSLFKDSEVVDDEVQADDKIGSKVDLLHRKSFTLIVPRGTNAATDRIYLLAEQITGQSAGCIEDIQVTKYDQGAFFRPHLDAAPGLLRKTTIIIYLNDQFEGGLTYFPKLGIAVQPVAGDALVFDNLDENLGLKDELLHSSTEILKGTKYIATAWVHAIERDMYK